MQYMNGALGTGHSSVSFMLLITRLQCLTHLSISLSNINIRHKIIQIRTTTTAITSSPVLSSNKLVLLEGSHHHSALLEFPLETLGSQFDLCIRNKMNCKLLCLLSSHLLRSWPNHWPNQEVRILIIKSSLCLLVPNLGIKIGCEKTTLVNILTKEPRLTKKLAP